MSMLPSAREVVNPFPLHDRPRRHRLARRKPRRPRPIARPRPNPRDAWPADVAGQRWTLAELEGPRPSYVEPGPSPADEAALVAFNLGYSHTPAEPPAGMGYADSLAWWKSFNLGWLRREHESIVGRRRLNRSTDRDIWPAGCPS